MSWSVDRLIARLTLYGGLAAIAATALQALPATAAESLHLATTSASVATSAARTAAISVATPTPTPTAVMIDPLLSQKPTWKWEDLERHRQHRQHHQHPQQEEEGVLEGALRVLLSPWRLGLARVGDDDVITDGGADEGCGAKEDGAGGDGSTVMGGAGAGKDNSYSSQQDGPFVLGPLPYNFSALEPVISTRIMQLHYTKHEAAYVAKANAAIAQLAPGVGGGNDTLPEIILRVGEGTLDPRVETALRNNAGGHWNHQLFWKVLAPPGSDLTSRRQISPELLSAIEDSFKSLDDMLTALKTEADGVFGSGWAWVCVSEEGAGGLQIVPTPNQDNPLMSLVCSVPCIPILGLDVWEHAYYLQYGPSRTEYTAAVLNIINWKAVSANYAAALRGELAAIGAEY